MRTRIRGRRTSRTRVSRVLLSASANLLPGWLKGVSTLAVDQVAGMAICSVTAEDRTTAQKCARSNPEFMRFLRVSRLAGGFAPPGCRATKVGFCISRKEKAGPPDGRRVPGFITSASAELLPVRLKGLSSLAAAKRKRRIAFAQGGTINGPVECSHSALLPICLTGWLKGVATLAVA